MKPKGLISLLLPFLALVFLIITGFLTNDKLVARSSGPPERSTPVHIDEDINSIGLSAFPISSVKGIGSGQVKLESALRQLIDEKARSGLQAALEMASSLNMATSNDRVLVVVESADGSMEELRGLLEAQGGSVTASNGNLIQAFLPLQTIDNVAPLPQVKRVRRPYFPIIDYTSEGLSPIGVPEWQAAGFNGSGIKIGIIDTGYYNYASLLGSELPPSTRLHAQSFRSDGDITGGGERHGTACAEIIYDVAPAADFYLANISTDVEFGQAVDWMISNGVNIVSVSLSWLGANNYDGTGFIDDKVNAARAAGIFWVNSAGDQAQKHWEGAFDDTNGNNWHNFTSSDEGQTFYAAAGTAIFAALTWDDPWSSSVNDYDLYLARTSDGRIVAGSDNTQPGSPPSEQVNWIADKSGEYFLAIKRYSGSQRNLELHTANYSLEYQVASGSLTAPADAAGAVAVGAFNYGSGSIEDFSSQGPTNDGRLKPEISAPDGVSTNSYGPTAFYGTSAAAPHVAGAAALVKQACPSCSPDQIQTFLEGRAIDAGSSGKDSIYGSGKLYLGTPPDPSGATATSTATATQTSTAEPKATHTATATSTATPTATRWGPLGFKGYLPFAAKAPPTSSMSPIAHETAAAPYQFFTHAFAGSTAW